METCVEGGELAAFTCGICKQAVCNTHMLSAHLYVNGVATGIVADIHAQGGQPAHPESLKGVGGPLVSENDTWEWRTVE